MPLALPSTMQSRPSIGGIEFPSVSRMTVIGITVAIAGNILISFALNLQKLAHARLEAARAQRSHSLEAMEPEGDASADGAMGNGVHRELTPPPEVEREARVWHGSTPKSTPPLSPRLETDPLVAFPMTANAEVPPIAPNYGALFPNTHENHGPPRRYPKTAKQPGVGVVSEYPDRPTYHGPNYESQYLKSKLWWLGFLLMNVGEIGNFISYAFAPASVVAPLGTFALVANCLFAPLLLQEQLRKRDLFGIALAMIGAVTVVLSSNTSDTRLSPEKLLEAVSQQAFLIFSVIYATSALILMGFSEGSVGRRWVLVDVGLCALFGGFTVLSTKAVSTLLTTNGFNMFKLPVIYPVLAVLIGTGIGQIRYLNRALMRFDSKVVIPTQFVLFNLSAILGSAILYGDFRTAKFHQFVTFLYGCAATFAGVWIIAWVPALNEPSTDPNDLGGAINDTETGGFVVDGVPAGGASRRPISVPVLGPRRSAVSLVGISSAQHLILAHTPPRPEIQLGQEHGAAWEAEHASGGRSQERLDGSVGRRRTITWLADGSPTPRLGNRIREQGSVERRWTHEAQNDQLESGLH